MIRSQCLVVYAFGSVDFTNTPSFLFADGLSQLLAVVTCGPARTWLLALFTVWCSETLFGVGAGSQGGYFCLSNAAPHPFCSDAFIYTYTITPLCSTLHAF